MKPSKLQKDTIEEILSVLDTNLGYNQYGVDALKMWNHIQLSIHCDNAFEIQEVQFMIQELETYIFHLDAAIHEDPEQLELGKYMEEAVDALDDIEATFE